MTTEELIEILEDVDMTEYRMFDKVKNKNSNRPDLHAFILLDGLIPGSRDLIDFATHDEFGMDIDMDELAEVITF